jgi:hypothetical protein
MSDSHEVQGQGRTGQLLTPTMSLRWAYDVAGWPELQQAWRDRVTGDLVWKEILFEDGSSLNFANPRRP